MSKNLTQPVILDEQGRPRFKANTLIFWMMERLRAKGITLNEYPFGDAAQEDSEQFYQLIGYSVGGYCELIGSELVSDDSADKAVEAAKATGFPWQQGTEAVAAWREANGY